MKSDTLRTFFSKISTEEFTFIKNNIEIPPNIPTPEQSGTTEFYTLYNLVAQSLPHNRKTGRYFTPASIAEHLINDIDIRDGNTYLEPSAGLGIFIFKLLDRLNKLSLPINKVIDKITLIEMDSELIYYFKLLFLHYVYVHELKFTLSDLNIIQDDFLTLNLKNKFDVIFGNPPFVDTKFIAYRDKYKNNFLLGNRNLFSMFIEKSLSLISKNGEIAFILSESFIFLKGYLKLRELLLKENLDITVHKLDSKSFKNANVGSIILNLRKKKISNFYFKLDKQISKIPKQYFYIKNYILPFNNFAPEIIDILKNNDNLEKHISCLVGIQTNNVKRYVIHEPENGSIPYIKRLKRRKSYWQEFNYWLRFENLIKENKRAVKKRHLSAKDKEGIVFNNIDHDSVFIAVYKPTGYLFDIVTPCIIPKDINLFYLLSYLNSHLAQYILFKFNGTPHTNINDVLKLPFNDNFDEELKALSIEAINNRKKKLSISKISDNINRLIYEQFDISKKLIGRIESELYENNIIIDKTI